MRYRVRTLLIALALLPPVLAWWGWPTLKAWMESKPTLTTPVTVTANQRPRFVLHDLGTADPLAVYFAARTKLPQTRMQLDKKHGKLAVIGLPSAHNEVEAIIGKSQRDAAKDTTN